MKINIEFNLEQEGDLDFIIEYFKLIKDVRKELKKEIEK